jgi:hypothetical protein
MQSGSRDPASVAQRYTNAPGPLKILGSGMGGVVFLAPDLRSAIKVHHHPEGFETEVEAYKRLKKARITKVRGLTIPRMRAHATDLLLIRMDVVRPPFLLDFAGALFHPPDFDTDAIAGWHANLEFLFGRNVSIVYDVYHLLSRHGIYYMDFRPSNIKLEGLADYDPTPDDLEDEGI